METRYRVTLTDEERAELGAMVSRRKSNARKIVRARILLLANQAVGGSPKTHSLFTNATLALNHCVDAIQPVGWTVQRAGAIVGRADAVGVAALRRTC